MQRGKNDSYLIAMYDVIGMTISISDVTHVVVRCYVWRALDFQKFPDRKCFLFTITVVVVVVVKVTLLVCLWLRVGGLQFPADCRPGVALVIFHRHVNAQISQTRKWRTANLVWDGDEKSFQKFTSRSQAIKQLNKSFFIHFLKVCA